jgi:Domain of unknown function (DUF4262)
MQIFDDSSSAKHRQMQPHDHDNYSNVESSIFKDVATVGWSVILIEATDYLPSFAYTIGLWKNYHHPEIIAFGLTIKTLHAILNIACEEIKNGKTYTSDVSYPDIFDNSDARFVPVDSRNINDYFGYAIWFNEGIDFPALQLVWTDRNNKFPWEENYEEEFVYRQPLLDRNAEFKFRESKRLAIFTTRQWLSENKPILRVVHDEDGDWQFLTGDQMPEDIKLVGLEEMVKKDCTINEIFDLEYGQQAERHSLSEEWIRGQVVSDD